jgi:hypothetical protein
MTRDRFLGEAEGNPFLAESLLRIAELADLEKRFIGWKRTIVGHSKEELKGQDLRAPNKTFTTAACVRSLHPRVLCLRWL